MKKWVGKNQPHTHLMPVPAEESYKEEAAREECSEDAALADLLKEPSPVGYTTKCYREVSSNPDTKASCSE